MSEHNTRAEILGNPIDRVDGPAKVTGQARYAAEQVGSKEVLTGWPVGATIAKGKITGIDTSAAEQAPGVRCVLTYKNAPEQNPFGEPADEGRFTQSRALLRVADVRHYGEPVALVVAQTLEQARYAASLVEVSYDAETPAQFLSASDATLVPEELDGGFEPDAETGDWQTELRNARYSISQRYSTPRQISAAMEPHASIAHYDGENLTLHSSVQILASAIPALANTLNIPPENIRVHSPFVGGGFGSKLGLHYDAILASLASMVTGQAVKVVLSRRQVFYQTPHRGNSRQDIKLGCDNDGALTAIRHTSAMPTARNYDFAEAPGAVARVTYQSRSISSTHRICVTDTPAIDSTRAPGDAIGSLAFEAAIDELAARAGIDPLTFRLNNMPDYHPVSQAPFTSHRLGDCLRDGAEKFQWGTKAPEADGKKRGLGVASAMRLNMFVASEARLSLDKNGHFTVQTDMTDIGTGTYTILTQIVADYFDVPMEQVTVSLGDSDYPTSCGSGGSFGAASAGSSVLRACQQMAEELSQHLPSNATGEGMRLHEDTLMYVRSGGGEEKIRLTELLPPSKPELSVIGAVNDEDTSDNPQYSCGAHFAEVEVDTVTGEVKLVRQLGVFSAGKILNHKTAASQLKGGMVWGAGYALREHLMYDHETASFINPDLAEYHIAVNRDIGDMEVHFIEEPDYDASPLGAKGIGELGITGAGAAIANAVFDAVGVRVRKYPITPDKVLSGLD